ncbi:MAG: serine hydrolase domain-containing protein, partial [Candidatus Cybelea sp.]
MHQILEEACGTQFTAAVARIEHRGRVIFERAYGITRADDLGRPVFADTRFDLASLTKLFIATLALQFVAQRRLELDGSLASFLPEWRDYPQSKVTLRMLLAHTSGMNSGADYRTIANENVTEFALRSSLVAAPGERVIYSDLGFIALGAVLERASGRSLAALVADPRFPSLTFRPRKPQRLQIPATEEDGWRGRV